MALLVNGEYIDDAAIREESEGIGERLRHELPDESGPELDMKVREWALENLIERALLRQAAWGFTEAQSGPDESLTRDTPGEDWRVAAFIDHLTGNVPRPQRREVSDYYRKNQILFLTPECVHASHIVKNADERVSEAEARAALEKAEAALRGGRAFAEVAEEYSDSPEAGGDLGWLARGEMPEKFESVVFALKPRQVSPIFRSGLGLHLAQVQERKKAGVLALREVYDVAVELMMKRRRDEVIERFVDDVRAKSEIRRVAGMKPEVKEPEGVEAPPGTS